MKHLSFNQDTFQWYECYDSNGVFEDGGKWFYHTIYFGSIETFGPFASEGEAKVAYLEHLICDWYSLEDTEKQLRILENVLKTVLKQMGR